jgi:protein-disulfide isomerase
MRALNSLLCVGAVAVGAGATGCRFTDDTWEAPPGTGFDASPDDAGVGFACPSGSPDLFNDLYSPYVGGEESVDIVIEDFSFLQCPHCASFAHSWESVWANRPDFRARARFYYHHFPLNWGQSAWDVHAIAAAASKQGMENFWALHDYIYSTLYNDGVALTPDQVKAYCADVLQLDMTQLELDVADPDTMAFLSWDKAQGEDAGITGTPSVFVCGEKISWSQLEDVLDGYLTEK